MADRSLIEWTDATWNPVIGCKICSPGCLHCYAMKLAGTRLQHTPSREGLTDDSKAGPVWNGQVRFMPEWLEQPLNWTKPRDVFVCAHSDLFYDGVDQDVRDQIFAVMWLASWHRFQVLTKRASEMAAYLLDPDTQRRVYRHAMRIAANAYRPMPHPTAWPLRHVIVGVSAETRGWFRDRLGPLARLKAGGWRTWASLEPLLGSIDILAGRGTLDWIVLGGESGKDARPMHPDWARGVRDQCVAFGIPFFFKQWGEWREFDHGGRHIEEVEVGSKHAESILPLAFNPGWISHGGKLYLDQDKLPFETPCRLIERVGKKAAGATLDGREWRQLPEFRLRSVGNPSASDLIAEAEAARQAGSLPC